MRITQSYVCSCDQCRHLGADVKPHDIHEMEHHGLPSNTMLGYIFSPLSCSSMSNNCDQKKEGHEHQRHSQKIKKSKGSVLEMLDLNLDFTVLTSWQR